MAKKSKKKETEAIGLDVQLSKSEAFIEKNLKTILTVLAAVVIIVAGWFAYRHYMDGVESKAEEAIAKSQQAFGQQQWEQALNGNGAAEMGLLKIIDEYGSTKTGNLAKLYAALCYAKTGKTDEAIKWLEKYKDAGDAMVAPAAVAALANCYVQKGENQKGAEMLVKAAKEADNDAISPICLLQAGQVYEELGQNDKALELYQQVKDKYFRSPLANEMDKYIEKIK